jgi:hypothetical protein
LVLAGANLPPEEDDLGLPKGDGGILTAEAIAALPLHNLELAVLSACETGIGHVAGGEGVFGLQRAFHIAGAQTVVASLWKVDDQVTRKLMTLFYKNLWLMKMGKLEALRQAQLTILNDQRIGSDLRGPGGKQVARLEAIERGRADPSLWAAWVLSGDPGFLPRADEPMAVESAIQAVAVSTPANRKIQQPPPTDAAMSTVRKTAPSTRSYSWCALAVSMALATVLVAVLAMIGFRWRSLPR